MKKKHKIFIYGTLRQDQEATHYLDGYSMFCVKGDQFSFPFIQYTGESTVFGSIIEVTDKELAQLDTYEGVARGLYVRKKVKVTDLDTTREDIAVWVYVGGPALAYPLIESGDWLDR